MLLVDVTIVGVALPQMSRDLHTQLSSLQWVVDAYALALAALLLLSGSLADRFGRLRLFQAGLLLFAAASLASALAPDAGLLIAARAVQGVGAAAMFATNTALLNATYEGRDRAVAFGIWGAINGAAAAIAPVLGGVLIAAAGWRAIFLVNLPIAVVAAVMTQRVLAESRGYRSPIDWAGAAFFTVCAATLTFALIHGGNNGFAGHSHHPGGVRDRRRGPRRLHRGGTAPPSSPARPGPVPPSRVQYPHGRRGPAHRLRVRTLHLHPALAAVRLRYGHAIARRTSWTCRTKPSHYQPGKRGTQVPACSQPDRDPRWPGAAAHGRGGLRRFRGRGDGSCTASHRGSRSAAACCSSGLVRCCAARSPHTRPGRC